MSGLSNYPPGVSGREYEISGPDREWEAAQPSPCPECGAQPTVGAMLAPKIALAGPRVVTFQAHPDRGAWWLCDECGEAVDVPEPEPDPEQDAYLRALARDPDGGEGWA